MPAVLIMLGCTKDSIESDYVGLYVCKSAIVASTIMDLNNDGTTSVDVLDELSQYLNIDMATTECGGVVYPFESGGNTKITLSIPAQSLRIYDDREPDMINGIVPQISASCNVQNDGSISIRSVDYSEVTNMVIGDALGNNLNAHLKDIQLLSIKHEKTNSIVAVMEASYYDFMTHQFVRQLINLEYVRIKKI